jgi:ribA/ribD-fused uncharacterized protein
MAIASFRGSHAFLSNFHASEVQLDGQSFPSVEHAYQAAKTLDLLKRTAIEMALTPGQAKRLGRRLVLRPGWEEVKVAVMRGLLVQKFALESRLAEQLLGTGDTQLVEGNTWGDTFWGECPVGTGENNLGRLLMEIREALR